jgi:hypothetical protein
MVACRAQEEVRDGRAGPNLAADILGGADRGLPGADPAAECAAGAGLPGETGAAAARGTDLDAARGHPVDDVARRPTAPPARRALRQQPRTRPAARRARRRLRRAPDAHRTTREAALPRARLPA